MGKNREISGKVGGGIGLLLAALALVAIYSYPAAAAIKRFKDDTGTLHIIYESAEKKPQTSAATSGGGPSRVTGPGAFPRPGVESMPPHPPQPPKAGMAPDDHHPEAIGPGEEEGPPKEPTPVHRGR